MTDFQRQVYTDMESTDRILLWMVKCQELAEFSEVMTEQDIKGLREICDMMKKEATP